MIVSKKASFPYPVLGHRRGIDSHVSSELKNERSGDEYVWTFHLEHDNEDIEHLIDNGRATYICEIDCASTNFRKCFYPNTDKEGRTIIVRIPINEIGGRVHAIVTAVAVDAIDSYHNSKSSSFYQAYSFNLEPGDILAIFGSWDIDLDISAETYKRITSIVQLEISDNEETQVHLEDNNSIVIEIPRSKYGSHEGKLKNPFYKPALLSSLVFEAFSYAIQQFDQYEGKTWARVLDLKSRKDLGIDISETIKEDPCLALEIARKILDDPHHQLYDLLEALDSSRELDDNDSTL